jgi:hypothetical protein
MFRFLKISNAAFVTKAGYILDDGVLQWIKAVLHAVLEWLNGELGVVITSNLGIKCAHDLISIVTVKPTARQSSAAAWVIWVLLYKSTKRSNG